MIKYSIYALSYTPDGTVYSFVSPHSGSKVVDVEVDIGVITLHVLEPDEPDTVMNRVVVELVFNEQNLMQLDACDFLKVAKVGKRSAAIFASVRA